VRPRFGVRLWPEAEVDVAERLDRSRSDIARDALRRRLGVLQFEEARRTIMPIAEARGYLTDEDVFRAVS
jgi:hypothetical protein